MLFSKSDRRFAEAVSKVAFANPFLPERVTFEKEALGNRFDPSTRPFWSWTLDDEHDRPNILLLTKLISELTTKLRAKISDGATVSENDFQLYDDLALYVLYYTLIVDRPSGSKAQYMTPVEWDEFRAAFEHWLNIDGRKSPSYEHAAHVYAYLHQLKRAFYNIFHCVIGRSWPIAKLRARIFQSVFTHDLRRFRNTLYKSMTEVTTLVVGPTGTGKELVAQAVGMSQYIPFDERTKAFVGEGSGQFIALNLSAFTPSLIESELFGHEKGSFTGAASRRIGWLESAGRYGTVFLDEIGELDLAIQVKLLRVLQNRQFQRIGENKTRQFKGKFIAATNRNLTDGIENATFREDFYYRLCSDVIVTPSLIDQISDRPDEFEFLVEFISRRVAPDDRDALKNEVMNWFESADMKSYDWPGNMRELEQCIRNIMIHNDYTPPTKSNHQAIDSFSASFSDCCLTAEQLLARYCSMAYKKHGSYKKAAAALQMDRRTLRAKSAQAE